MLGAYNGFICLLLYSGLGWSCCLVSLSPRSGPITCPVIIGSWCDPGQPHQSATSHWLHLRFQVGPGQKQSNSWHHPYSAHQPIPGSDVSINPRTAFSYRTHSFRTLETYFGNFFLTSWYPFGTLSHQFACSHTLTLKVCIALRKQSTCSCSSPTGIPVHLF